MRAKLCLTVILGLLLVSGCKKAEESYCSSACARCGLYRHSETKSGVTIRDDTRENDLSVWLSAYRPEACKHVWIPLAGWSSENNLAWHGMSHWDDCLRRIKQLHPTIGEPDARQLLKRYYSILEAAYGPEEDDKPVTPSTDPKVHKKIEEFSRELKSRLDQIDDDGPSAH